MTKEVTFYFKCLCDSIMFYSAFLETILRTFMSLLYAHQIEMFTPSTFSGFPTVRGRPIDFRLITDAIALMLVTYDNIVFQVDAGHVY